MRKVSTQFGNPSGLIGWLVGIYMAGSKKERVEWTINLMDIQPGDAVFEIGFGPGTAVQQMAQVAPDVTITGIEHSDVMVRQASKLNESLIQQGRVKLIHGSAAELPLDDTTYNKVLMINVLHHLEDQPAVLGAVHGMLKSGDTLTITDQPWGELSLDELAGEIEGKLNTAGFSSVVKNFNPELKAVCIIGAK